MSGGSDFDWDEPAGASAGTVHPALSRNALVGLGVLTFWPVFYILLFMLMVATLVFGASVFGSSLADSMFPALAVFHLGTILLTFVMTIYYTVYVVTDARFEGAPRIIWILVVLLGGIIGQGIFYVLWFWKRDPTVLSLGSTPSAPPAPGGPMPPPSNKHITLTRRISGLQ